MRKYIAMILVVLLCFSFCGFTYETIDETTERIEYLQTRQYHANSMANSARELGYDDESLIITEAKNVWHSADDEIQCLQDEIEQMYIYNLSDEEISWLEGLIFYEGRAFPEMYQLTPIGLTALNRIGMSDGKGGIWDNLEEVLKAKGQYGYETQGATATLIFNKSYLNHPEWENNHEKIEEAVKLIITGKAVDENGEPFPDNMIYQHSFKNKNALGIWYKTYNYNGYTEHFALNN